MSRDGNFTASRISEIEMSQHSTANNRYKSYLKQNGGGTTGTLNSGDSLFQDASS